MGQAETGWFTWCIAGLFLWFYWGYIFMLRWVLFLVEGVFLQ